MIPEQECSLDTFLLHSLAAILPSVSHTHAYSKTGVSITRSGFFPPFASTIASFILIRTSGSIPPRSYISSKASNGAVAEPQACRYFRVPEHMSAPAKS